jgi:hypothetical protein
VHHIGEEFDKASNKMVDIDSKFSKKFEQMLLQKGGTSNYYISVIAERMAPYQSKTLTEDQESEWIFTLFVSF